MPQMAPLWWEILYSMFIVSFLMMNIMMYFSFKTKINKNVSNNKKTNQLNWTW